MKRTSIAGITLLFAALSLSTLAGCSSASEDSPATVDTPPTVLTGSAQDALVVEMKASRELSALVTSTERVATLMQARTGASSDLEAVLAQLQTASDEEVRAVVRREFVEADELLHWLERAREDRAAVKASFPRLSELADGERSAVLRRVMSAREGAIHPRNMVSPCTDECTEDYVFNMLVVAVGSATCGPFALSCGLVGTAAALRELRKCNASCAVAEPLTPSAL